MDFCFRLIPEKTDHKYLQKLQKNTILGFPRIRPMIFFFIELHQLLALAKSYVHAKQQKKSKEPFPRKDVNRQRDKRTNKQQTELILQKLHPPHGCNEKKDVFFLRAVTSIPGALLSSKCDHAQLSLQLNTQRTSTKMKAGLLKGDF